MELPLQLVALASLHERNPNSQPNAISNSTHTNSTCGYATEHEILANPRMTIALRNSPTRQTNHQNVIRCSPAMDEPNKSQVSRLTKYLLAVILSLVVIIVLLLYFDLSGSSTRTPRSQRHKSAIASSSAKLQAASSDNHYFAYPHDRDDDPEVDSDDNNDPDSTDQQHPGRAQRHRDAQDGDTDTNQIVPPTATRHRSDNNYHRPPISSKAGPNKQLRDPDSYCMTPGCVRAAAQILNNMDNRTNPCEDFYQFACGRWIETQVIPDERTSLSVFSQNTADLNIRLRALIERKPTREDPPIVGEMRNLYASCMNMSDIEARGDEPLLDVLKDFGGWPVVESSQSPATSGRQQTTDAIASTSGNNGEKFNWLETIIKFRRRGFSHDMIIDLSVVPDVRNSKRYIIELDQSSLGLPDRSYYFKGLNDTTVAAYYNLMVDSAVILGASRPEARRQMGEALEFETSLAKISVPREQRRNVTRLYNKMLTKDLYSLAPNIDWQRYLSTLLKDNDIDLERDEVIVKVPSFLQAIDKLLTTTEPRIVANYMMWRIVRHSMGGLSRKWRELAHGYSTVITGRQVDEPRWEQCLGSLEGALGTALSAMYVKNHFNKESKAAAMEMVDYIREEFLRILNEVDWMDEETRAEARLKARAISPYIGYPDELLRDELIEELYAGVKMSRTNFYQNTRNLRIWSTDYAFGQLRKPNKRGDWKKHARAAVVNAYYNSLENSIEFPAGILQGAFFDAERPSYMNFGAIGYVIGHEITHGFDDRGRQFDKDGNDRNWWKPKTDARFRERAQCIIEQYGNYTVNENGLKVNGLNTQGENIADNGGIKEAFRAYRKWTKDHGREPRLPGLDYSPDQLFWISAANIWCGKFRPEVLKLRVNSGVHSPARFRIIGPLSNSPEFAQSFNCPSDTPMNPRKKCSVW